MSRNYDPSIPTLLTRAFGGRSVVVLGSGRDLEDLTGETFFVAVNGGIYKVPPGRVDVWVVNAREGVPGGLESHHDRMLKTGARRHVRFLVQLSRGTRGASIFQARLKEQGTVWDEECDIHYEDREHLEWECGVRTNAKRRDVVPSAGVTAVALACGYGAWRVRMEGFSWEAGYSYTSRAPEYPRGHADSDKRALWNLQQKYPGVIHTRLSIPSRERKDRMTTSRKTLEELNQPPAEKVSMENIGTIVGAAETVATELAGAGVPKAAAVVLLVRALKMLFYNGRRRKPGDTFTLRSPLDFKKTQMEVVAPETPVVAPVEDTRQARGTNRVRGPRLQPNAVDLEPEVATPGAMPGVGDVI